MKSLSYLIVCLLLFATSCKKNDTEGRADLKIFLVDAPADYEAVNIDIRDVQINLTSDSESGWKSLNNINRGIYDLLTLTDGKSVMLSNTELAAGRVEQIRLILGDQNTIQVKGNIYPLSTPSAQQSGLKLNIHQDLKPGGFYRLILDFDAGRSIVENSDSNFSLKPVIRSMLENAGGDLKGMIAPREVSCYVALLKGNTQITSTYTDTATGGFQFQGIEPGIYSIIITPSDTQYLPVQKDNISITEGGTNELELIELQ